MRIINEALEDSLGKRKDRLNPQRTWKAVVERGIGSFENESADKGDMVFFKFYDRDIFIPRCVAEWADKILEDQRNGGGAPQIVPIPIPADRKI
jgi:hypothetical protein